jgi:hypothetical protein
MKGKYPMVELTTLIALAVSLAAFMYLRLTDPRTRQVYRLPPSSAKRHTGLAWGVSLLPGVALLLTGQNAPFVMWFAALPLLGWLVALPKSEAASVAATQSRRNTGGRP